MCDVSVNGQSRLRPGDYQLTLQAKLPDDYHLTLKVSCPTGADGCITFNIVQVYREEGSRVITDTFV